MKRKVVIITALLSPEALEVKDEDLEASIKAYLEPENIPFVEKIDKIKVLSEG